MKEWLSAREVDYISVNVAEEEAVRKHLADAGLRSLPVVSRGDVYVSGIDLPRVAELFGFSYDGVPALSAETLVSRYERVLAAAVRFAGQIPTERLGDKLPNRDRSYLALANHLVQIAVDYLEITRGAEFKGPLAASTPEIELDVERLAAKSARASHRLRTWLAHSDASELARVVPTYFGEQTLHQVLERCVWHSAQHARQLMMVLGLLGVDAVDPLTPDDFADLPMPEGVWDG